MTYWSDMYIKSGDSHLKNNSIIISKEPPIKYDDHEKKINLLNGIKPSVYEEVSNFIKQHNRMSTGNTTLLPTKELERYLDLENISILMRSQNNNKLMGTIISLLLPIKVVNGGNKEIITHGCATFLNVHSAIRGFGMCMAIIREGISLGYEKGIYCDYHMLSFKLGDNSVKIKSWYRPINLSRSKTLGFLYPGYNDLRSTVKTRLKYTTILRGTMNYDKVSSTNIDYYNYYLSTIKNKKFSFYPDITLWKKWVTSFPTYIIYNNSSKVGIVSLNTTYCTIESTKETGRVCFPVICNGDMQYVLPVLGHIARNENYDVIYFYQHGDLTDSSLESFNAIKSDTNVWVSLYNNSIDLKPEDIYAPLL